MLFCLTEMPIHTINVVCKDQIFKNLLPILQELFWIIYLFTEEKAYTRLLKDLMVLIRLRG